MITTKTIKETHLQDVRIALRELKKATKPQLAEKTGLSVVTINALIRTLLENGEVYEANETITKGGRPACVYMLNSDYRMALLFGTLESNGQDVYRISVMNVSGEIVEPCQTLTELNIENLDSSISYYMEKYPAISAVIFGLPAKEADGKIVFCDYPALNGFPLREHIREHYGTEVVIRNDVSTAILGYSVRNRLAPSVPVAGIYFPQKYSAGVSLFINGDNMTGNRGVAAEVEYLPEFHNMDWKKRTFEQTLHMIVTVCVMYNPDVLLVYDSLMTEESLQKIQDFFANSEYHHFLPSLQLISEIESDYEYGMKQLAFQIM